MDAAFEQKYHAMEREYWWFRGRRDCIIRTMARMEVPWTARILEIGCSGGPLLQMLVEEGYQDPAGIDISPSAISRCRERGLKNVTAMDAQEPSFEEGTFDLVIASDVLEHLTDARRALVAWQRILKPDGRLIVFVPAFMFLWSGHDEVNHHQKRYTAGGLKRDLALAGFEVERTGYWNTFLFGPITAIRLLGNLVRRRGSGDQIAPVRPIVNEWLVRVLKVENACIAAGLRLPIGVSALAVARRKH
jgi:SAM-dependent methyltransferase